MFKFRIKKNFDPGLSFWLIVISILAGIAAILIVNTGNKSQQNPHRKNYAFKSISYNFSGDGYNFCKKIENLIPRISTYGLPWKLVSSECRPSENSPYIIRAEVPVFFFKDDLEIKMQPSADYKRILIEVKSQSRIGKNDFGENSRHINALFKALDKNLK